MATQTLDLTLGDLRAPVYVLEQTTERSAHTGRDLHVIRGKAVATGEDMHDFFTSAVNNQGTEGIRSREHPTIPVQQWTVAIGSYSIRDDQYTYEVTLRQVESFEIESLVIHDLELRPYRYQENVRDGEIDIIKAMVRVAGDDLRRLAKRIEEGGYFNVIRRGINDEPIQVRFGLCGWSEHDAERKYSLIIVPRSYDQKNESGQYISTAASFHRHDALAYRIELMDEIIRMLVEKQVLSAVEVERARESAHGRIPERRQMFYEVPDADELAW